MFKSVGNAVQPALMLKHNFVRFSYHLCIYFYAFYDIRNYEETYHTERGLSTLKPNNVQASLVNTS